MHNEPMKTVHIMNFARQCEPRDEATDRILFDVTKKQLEMLNELNVPNTFLLQYDALCDERYVKLFRQKAGAQTEIGLWHEIVEPLTAACGMAYESVRGWKWDWHIKPGFSMGYAPEERDALIDEAMRKFREIFGRYPGVVGSWLIDTQTACRLADRYGVKCLCICRDQINTDAYSLVGGYFNGAYYPSRKNIFTPAQTREHSLGIPVFRLLGPDPIHNYDGTKFVSQEAQQAGAVPWTLEPAWCAGGNQRFEDAMLDYLFGEDVLNFGYAQIGQENSFGDNGIVDAIRRQIEKLLRRGDVRFEKMSETAERFAERFANDTPATITAGLKNWDKEDVQSVYYQCKNYVANLFRDGKRVFIRAFYLFDENVPEHYAQEACDTFYALYENLPLVDTAVWAQNERENVGLTLDENGGELSLEILSDTDVRISWRDKSAVFTEDGIRTAGVCEMTWKLMQAQAQIRAAEHRIDYEYNGTQYSLATNGSASIDGNILTIRGDSLSLTPERAARKGGSK